MDKLRLLIGIVVLLCVIGLSTSLTFKLGWQFGVLSFLIMYIVLGFAFQLTILKNSLLQDFIKEMVLAGYTEVIKFKKSEFTTYEAGLGKEVLEGDGSIKALMELLVLRSKNFQNFKALPLNVNFVLFKNAVQSSEDYQKYFSFDEDWPEHLNDRG